MLIELLPLRPPSEVWRTNWVYWLRLFLATTALSLGVGMQTSIIVPASDLRSRHAVLIALGPTGSYMLQLFLLHRFWCFPVLFTVLIGTPAWQLSLLLSVKWATRMARARDSAAINRQIRAAVPLMQMQMQAALMLAYSSYNAVFLRLNSRNQIAFMLVLQLSKYALNRLLALISRDVLVSSGWSFISVKLFDELYLFKCIYHF